MRPLSIYVITPSAETAETVRQGAARAMCPVVVEQGGIDTAITTAKTWSAIPDVLILDVSEEECQEDAIRAFAAAAPEGETSLVIIGRGDDVKTYRAFKRLGATEYIPAPLDEDEIDSAIAAVRRTIAGRSDIADPDKLLLVVSARGGAGSSTIAAEIGRAVASRHGRRTLIVDLDTESGCQHSLFGVDPTPGLAMMLDNPESVDALLLNRTIGKTAERNLFLLSDVVPESAGRFAASAPGSLMNAISRDLDTIVLDVPARSPFFRDLTTIAGTLVVVAPPTYHGLRETMGLLDTAEKLGGPKRVIVFVNRVGEVKTGSVGPDIFRQKLAKGARPEFRDRVSVVSLPYAPKQALRTSNTSESLLDEAGSPIAKALAAAMSQLPTAPAPAKRAGFLSKLIGG